MNASSAKILPDSNAYLARFVFFASLGMPVKWREKKTPDDSTNGMVREHHPREDEREKRGTAGCKFRVEC